MKTRTRTPENAGKLLATVFCILPFSGCFSIGTWHSLGRQRGFVTAYHAAYRYEDEIAVAYESNVGGSKGQHHWLTFPVEDLCPENRRYRGDLRPRYRLRRSSMPAAIAENAGAIPIVTHSHPRFTLSLVPDPDTGERVDLLSPDVDYIAWWGYVARVPAMPLALAADMITFPFQLYMWRALSRIDR